jgi:hypothetical protein
VWRRVRRGVEGEGVEDVTEEEVCVGMIYHQLGFQGYQSGTPPTGGVHPSPDKSFGTW